MERACFTNNYSRIASITVGQVYGTVSGTDTFAFEAQSIGKIKIGGTMSPLTSGTDSFLVSTATGSDVGIREVASGPGGRPEVV